MTDGVFQLATAEHLQLFSSIVSFGMDNAKAVMTNDIDMSEAEDFMPIGTSDKPFTGEFDGQGNKVTGFTLANISGNRIGLFGFIKNA